MKPEVFGDVRQKTQFSYSDSAWSAAAYGDYTEMVVNLPAWYEICI